MVLVTVFLAIVIAYLLAMYLRFVKSPISRAIGNLYLVPRFVPGLVAVYAMITIIRDSGLINRISQLFGADVELGMMYHASGMITMNLWFNIPFAALMITAGLGAIPDSVIEGARDVGANRWKVFTSMVLPLSIKDVVIAGTFVFMSNVGSFTTPYLMGGNSPKMLGISLFDQFNKYQRYERAAALSVIIFLICSGLHELPDDGTPYSGGIKVAVIVMFCIIPMLAWTATLIAMKGYALTGEKMKTIQAVNAARKEAVAQGMGLEQAMESITDETVGKK